MKSKDLCLVQLCLDIHYYISGWKMFSNNSILLEVSLAAAALALDVYS